VSSPRAIPATSTRAARLRSAGVELDSRPPAPVRIMMNVGNPIAPSPSRHSRTAAWASRAGVHHQPDDRRASARPARVRAWSPRPGGDRARRPVTPTRSALTWTAQRGIAQLRRRCAEPVIVRSRISSPTIAISNGAGSTSRTRKPMLGFARGALRGCRLPSLLRAGCARCCGCARDGTAPTCR